MLQTCLRWAGFDAATFLSRVRTGTYKFSLYAP